MASMAVKQESSSSSLETTDMVRGATRVVAMVVFLGTLLVWVMMPTATYKNKWLPVIKSKYNQSTYFGNEGRTLLLYTLPILFVAALGCLYLHLGTKRNRNIRERSKGEKKFLAPWRRPMLVKGPLGIVSTIELTFFLMFIALLVWSLSTYIHNSFATVTPQSAAQYGEKVWESKLANAAEDLGLVGNICLAFLFFPVTRGSSVLPLFGLTSESSIKYHIWLGHLVLLLFTAHGLGFIIVWVLANSTNEMLKWDQHDVSIVAGEISLVAGLLMWATTFPRIRRKMFELFFYTHHLYIIFIVFFILHVGISFSLIMLPGFYLFMVDRYLRFLQSRRRVQLVSARLLPFDTLELNFSKTPSLSYSPTSIMFINVPSISKLQWHPFTVTSNSNLEPERLSLVIKSEGSWSTKLYQMLSSPSSVHHLEVSLEGPYGPASSHFLRHEKLVMVSGGSGITPFISVIRELIFMSQTMKCKTPDVTLICAFKKTSDLTMLDLILPITGAPSDLSNLHLQIEAYVTRETQPSNSNLKLRTLWFKPHVRDSPVSPILGPNGWLWLGAIISSSFVMFLVLIGFITRYYIYPIDHNSNKIFSYSWRAVLNMLAVCVSIAATASAAILWNRKRYANEGNQIQNIEEMTPTVSPAGGVGHADRELGSLLNQSLVETTVVHYGKKPDLKRILLGFPESSVGVLVSGPKKMRHEAARISSSGLAQNLHFESISFSW